MSELQEQIAKLRKDYQQGDLDEKSILSDPVAQFQKWFSEALKAAVPEPNAMALATASKQGLPAVRIVLLRGATQRGFTFFTNYDSRKGQEIADNPEAALLFFWPELERQIRIEGRIEFVSPEESDDYFLNRPWNNRLSAWASPQSAQIPNREFLEDLVKEYQAKFKDAEIHRPENWGGYRLVPRYIEFWQGRSSRLHDRLAFSLQSDQSWKLSRLAP
jgi:pyridoxamine 5'-phosphate oxidase